MVLPVVKIDGRRGLQGDVSGRSGMERIHVSGRPVGPVAAIACEDQGADGAD